ncbi:hypothetical protein [Parageobacillus sp. G301]|jgi:uncharacterized PurR-regulated membrane protein YhhQ (DUF165 family)|uniref:hypothetical protein n=1 Tax=Parageobacillus sp. G301 TaxID=2998290 RepID=UPI00249995CB|nr:hypothetical protein [Parageobacillus sp. G301]GLH64530.1 hypothetical protein PG301_23690 [Parageobacillus sp. G301]
MKMNTIILKIVIPAFLTALGFLAVDYIFEIFGDVEERTVFLRFIIYLAITHLMMYGIVRRNIKKQEERF